MLLSCDTPELYQLMLDRTAVRALAKQKLNLKENIMFNQGERVVYTDSKRQKFNASVISSNDKTCIIQLDGIHDNLFEVSETNLRPMKDIK